jgi:hypothetical protein
MVVAQPGTALIAGLMALSMLLFVVGVVSERAVTSTHATPCVQQPSGETGADGDHPAAASCVTRPTADADGGEARTSGTTASETVLGIAIDSPGITALAVAGWLTLIAALLRFGRRALPLVLVAAAAATVFDVGEVLHQIHESRSGLAILATFVAVGHAAVAVLALRMLAHAPRPNRDPLMDGHQTSLGGLD